MPYEWHQIAEQLANLEDVRGGYSGVRRGIVTLPDGTEVFVKVGVKPHHQEWARKEVGVYRFLETRGFADAPRLLATNADESGFAIEAMTVERGWNWGNEWSRDRLVATMAALDDLAALEPSTDERNLLSGMHLGQDDNGWRSLLASTAKQTMLIEKLHRIGASDVAARIDFAEEARTSGEYRFADDTLVHYDVRADNCGWNSALGAVTIVDWNWAQLGDRGIDSAATLTHVQRCGIDVAGIVPDAMEPAAFHWMAGFWFDAAVTPIWEGGPEQLRDSQLLSGVTALRLAQTV